MFCYEIWSVEFCVGVTWIKFWIFLASILVYCLTPIRRRITDWNWTRFIEDIPDPDLLTRIFRVSPFTAGDINRFISYQNFLASFKQALLRALYREDSDGIQKYLLLFMIIELESFCIFDIVVSTARIVLYVLFVKLSSL